MRRALSKDGTSIAYERSGVGKPLILVDGALCSRSFGPMPKLVPLLEPHFTVYWYDRRGRNQSGETIPYSVAREVEDLEALVNEAGGSAFVYGVSSGAALALEAAAHTLPYDAAIVGDASLLGKRAATVSVPTLVMGGEKSPAVLREAVRAVGEAVPGSKRRMLAGQTHNVAPQAIAPVLVEYFAAA